MPSPPKGDPTGRRPPRGPCPDAARRTGVAAGRGTPGRTLDGDLRIAARVAPRTEAVVEDGRRLTYAELDSGRRRRRRRPARTRRASRRARRRRAAQRRRPRRRDVRRRCARAPPSCSCTRRRGQSGSSGCSPTPGPSWSSRPAARRGSATAARVRSPSASRAPAPATWPRSSTRRARPAPRRERRSCTARSTSPPEPIAAYLGLTGSDRILCALPLSHIYGLSQLLVAVRSAATLVLEHGVAFPGRLVATLERERITALPGVPTLWQVLLGLAGARASATSRACALLTNAGAALPPARVEEVRRLFPRRPALRDVRPDRVQPRLAGSRRRSSTRGPARSA